MAEAESQKAEEESAAHVEARKAFVNELIRTKLPSYKGTWRRVTEWQGPLKLSSADDDDNGLDECLACCCASGVHQTWVWNVSFDDAAWLVSDDEPHGFNRMLGDGTSHVMRELNQELVRIQAIFTQAKASFDSQQAANSTATEAAGGVKAEAQAVGTVITAATIVAPEDVTMERGGSGSGVAAELKEIIAMRESGALSEEEFLAAKAKVLA